MSNNKIAVFGGSGLVGAAIKRELLNNSDVQVLSPSHSELDLINQAAVDSWISEHQPAQIYLVAGTVGGIKANSTRPAEFLYNNLMIHANIIHASYEHQIEKLLYLGSSCIYPRMANQPIEEDQLLTGELEPTNEAYALAKITGIKMCSTYREQYGCNFISAMPTNLYGPGDNFDADGGHVIPSMITKFHEAKVNNRESVTLWGTGTPLREFLHVSDLASACIFLMREYDGQQHINIGSGEELSIRQLSELIRDTVYPECEITWDSDMPDGTPRKLLDSSKLIHLGWKAQYTLRGSINDTYAWYLSNILKSS
jgi:GDP-L-fucose synthase